MATVTNVDASAPQITLFVFAAPSKPSTSAEAVSQTLTMMLMNLGHMCLGGIFDALFLRIAFGKSKESAPYRFSTLIFVL